VELQSRDGEDARRTAVHHMEGDAGEEWPGFDCERLCDWLLARLPGAPPPPTVAAAPGPAGARAMPALALEAEVVDGLAEQPIAQVALGRPWAVEVRWTLAEPLPAAMAGEWVVRAAFEPIGAGEPLSAAEEPRRIAAVPGAASSRCRIDVAAGVATSAHGGPIYRGVVVLTHEARAAGIPPAAWYVDLRPIQFGEPGD
jgi:hypothetical protein